MGAVARVFVGLTVAIDLTPLLASSIVSEAREFLVKKGLLNPVLVGGSIRDFLLDGRSPRDLDFIVSSDELEVLRRSPDSAVGQNRHGNVRVYLADIHMDLFAPQTFFGGFEDVERALAFFDVNVNAVGIAIGDGRTYDPVGGFEAIRRGVVELIPARWRSEASPEDKAVLLARLLTLFRRHPHLKISNPDLAMNGLESAFNRWPGVIAHYDLGDTTDAAEELTSLLKARAVSRPAAS